MRPYKSREAICDTQGYYADIDANTSAILHAYEILAQEGTRREYDDKVRQSKERKIR